MKPTRAQGYISTSPRPGAGIGGSSNLGTERMVVLVGSQHVQGRVGVPDRFTRRTNLATFTVVPVSIEWPATGRPTPEPPSAAEADWVLFTPPQPDPEDGNSAAV